MSPLCLVVLSVTFLLPYTHSWLYAMWLLLVSRLVQEVDGIRKERKNNADKSNKYDNISDFCVNNVKKHVCEDLNAGLHPEADALVLNCRGRKTQHSST